MHDILIEDKILSQNGSIAAENRRLLRDRGVFTVNIVSSPGAGKTSILERSIPYLKGRLKLAVIEGDLALDLDAERISRHGVPVRQITTGRACHLDAHYISHELPWVFGQGDIRLLVIENVGNMVCPAEYDLGEDLMLTVLSVAEGDDKPLKYPAIFSSSDAAIINKIDLAPHTDFDMGRAKENIRKINPSLKIFLTSCRTGEGIKELSGYITELALNEPVLK